MISKFVPPLHFGVFEIDARTGELRKQGLSLDELIESGREIRGELHEALYGRDG